MQPINVYIAYSTDLRLDRQQMAIGDEPDNMAKLAQSVELGNNLWKEWAISSGGRWLGTVGDVSYLEIGADHLGDLPNLVERYGTDTKGKVSVGLGKKLSEADQALRACLKTSPGTIRLFDDTVGKDLSEDQEEWVTKSEFVLVKAMESNAKFDPANGGGFQAPQQPAQPDSTPAQPVEPQAPQFAPQQAPQDLMGQFQALAEQSQGEEQAKDEAAQGSQSAQDLREQIAATLEDFRGQAETLETLQQSDPELYKTLVEVVQNMIAMARELYGNQPVQKSEDLTKALPKTAKNPTTVFHVGHLDTPRKPPHFSQEGGELSVSIHPEAWTKIAKLSGPTHTLSNPKAKFLHIKEAQHKPSIEWGVKNGFLEPTTKFRAYSTDEEGGRRYSEHDTEAEARNESDEVEAVPGYKFGPRGVDYWHRSFPTNPNVDHSMAVDFAPIFFGRASGYDGVWYHDLLDPDRLSAPRGLIFQERLANWHQKNSGALKSEATLAFEALAKSYVGPKYDTVESFMTGIKQQPTPAAKGLYITAHLGHAPFLQALKTHPQGPTISKQLWSFVNGRANATVAGAGVKATAKTELQKDAMLPSPYIAKLQHAKKPGKTGHFAINMPPGSQVDTGPTGSNIPGRKGGRKKIVDPATNKTRWREMRAGQVMAPDGTPTSSRHPFPGGDKQQ